MATILAGREGDRGRVEGCRGGGNTIMTSHVIVNDILTSESGERPFA